MFKVGNIAIHRPITLAPMEDITDISYRLLCKEMGADIVYTEFVNSDGLIRDCSRAKKKTLILDEERPVGIQIYGHNIESMVGATKKVNDQEPDLIDINAGCWVKKVSGRGAGAGLLKDPEHFQKMVESVVAVSEYPVTVKTRLGWDEQSINILEIAKRIEDVGAVALTIHCRTRSQGLTGTPDWQWVEKIKQEVDMPVMINGGIMTAWDVERAFTETPCDGVMVARGAIGMPWIFSEAKEILQYGEIRTPQDIVQRAEICLRHLHKHLEYKGEKRGIPSFRKYYGGYFKEFHGASQLRRQLVTLDSLSDIIHAIGEFVESQSK